MLKTLKIENFRGFQSFELQPLGRVNLLVGENNSGKTSILEAIQLLCSKGTFNSAIIESLIRRGECFWSQDNHWKVSELNICHLFRGHQLKNSSQFLISGWNGKDLENLLINIQSSKPGTGLLQTRWECNQSFSEKHIKLSLDLGVNIDDLTNHPIFYDNPMDELMKTFFVVSSSLTAEKMIELFEDIVLTPEEKFLYEALKTIEPTIDRIASIGSKRYKYSDSRGGFVVLFSDREQRIPIGSLGDGIWRMLGLSLALASVKGGVLLVDEIDTGLHYSTMSDLWKLIWEAAKKLDVQVFATTHNSDCWTSLASIASREDATEDGITIHRIERGKEKSVVFTEKEIVMAAEREIEVR